MRNMLSVICVMVLCPVLLALGVNGFGVLSNTSVQSREEYLPMLIYRDIPEEYDKEVLKAQAVLERSSLSFYSSAVWKELIKECCRIAKMKDYQVREQEIEEAIAETEDIYITIDGKIMPGIFHRVSAGYTRDGTAAGLKAYEKLKSVLCSEDSISKDYFTKISFSPQKLSILAGRQVNSLKIIKRDASGYVTRVAINGVLLDGEIFRKMINLPSACFTMEMDGEVIVFSCRGQGHGYGLSQSEAQRMAENGENCLDILEFFFPEYEIIKK